MGREQAATCLTQFNETVEKWIIFLDDYTLEMLWRKPRSDSWSLGQVYVHVIDDTKYFVEQMEVSLSDTINRDKEMHADAKAIFANNGFPDILLEGPATNTSVRQPRSKDELLQGLALIKDEVNRLYFAFDLEGSNGKNRTSGVVFF